MTMGTLRVLVWLLWTLSLAQSTPYFLMYDQTSKCVEIHAAERMTIHVAYKAPGR